MATLLKESNFSSSNNFKIRLEYSYSQDTANNKTTITYYNYFVSMNGYSGSGANTTGYINNASVGSTTSIGVNEKKLLGKKSVTVTHNQDGTFPNTSYSASISSPWQIGTASVSGTLTSSQIPKINRASTWGVGSLNLDDVSSQFELSINQYISEYHNVVTITNANKSTTVKTINNAINGTQVQFTSSELNDLYALDNNKNINPIRFNLNLYTYDSNNNQIGNEQTIIGYGSLSNPEPTATVTIEEQNANVISLLGSATSNKIVKYASSLKFSITATPKYGADISNVWVSGKIATYNETTQKYEVTLTDLTINSFLITVADTRAGNGVNTTEISETKISLPYLIVAFNTWSIERASAVSSDLILNADITCYSSTIDGNTNTPTVQYSIDNSTWSTIQSSDYTFADDKITITNLTLNDLIPYTTYGTFYLKVSDLLTTANDNKQISKGIETYSWGENDLQVNGDIFIADENGENAVNIMNKITQKGRARVYKYNTTNQTIESTTDTNITGMSTTINTYGGDIFVCASLNLTQSNNVCTVTIYVDNTAKGKLIELSSASGRQQAFGMIILTDISAGSHTFTLKAKVQNSGNVATFHSYSSQQFTIVEL